MNIVSLIHIANQLQSLNEMVGVSLRDLPADMVDQIEAIAKTANILECIDTASTRY